METSRIVSIAVEAIIYLITFVAYHKVDDSVPHTKRGFFCGDPAISMPFKKSTVRGILLYWNLYTVPIAIWLIELILHGREVRKKFYSISKRALIWFKQYFFTFMALMIFMASVKNLTGSLRPYFLEVCQPNTALNCTKGEYINADFECTNTKAYPYLLFDARRSFPSGHVVVSTYATVYFMWFLQARFSKYSLQLAFVHLVCVLWLAVCSITRITDNWHHFFDVIGGFLLTLPFVVFVCLVQCDKFQVRKKAVNTD